MKARSLFSKWVRVVFACLWTGGPFSAPGAVSHSGGAKDPAAGSKDSLRLAIDDFRGTFVQSSRHRVPFIV